MTNFEIHQRSKVLPLKFGQRISACVYMFKKVRNNPDILVVPVRIGNQ